MFRKENYEVHSVKWNGEYDAEFTIRVQSIVPSTKDIIIHFPRKDFWHPERNWEEILAPNAVIRIWETMVSRTTVGLQVLSSNGQWEDVWCAANNKAQREASDRAYIGAIEDVSKKLIELMDGGATPEKALESIKGQGLSGSQAGEAVNIAVSKSKRGEVLKEHWNAVWGVKKDFVVNPAIVEVR